MEVEKYAKVISSASKLGSLPFEWEGNRMRITKCSRQRVKWGFYVSLFGMYVIFLTWQIVLIYKTPYAGSTFHLLIVSMAFLALLCPSIYHIVAIFKPQDATVMVNAYFSYTEWFTDKYARKEKRRSLFRLSHVNHVIRTTTWALRALVVGFICFFLFDPSLPLHVTSAFRAPVFVELTLNLIYCITISWTLPATVYALLVYIIIGLAIPLVMVRINHELNLGRREYSTLRSVRKISGISLNFRCLQFLNNIFADIGRSTFVPVQLIISRTLNICTFVLVRHPTELGAPGFLLVVSIIAVMTLVWTNLLYICACVEKSSRETVKSWKTLKGVDNAKVVWGAKGEEIRYFHKFRKSCKPIGIHFGNFYVVTHFKIIRFLSLIARGGVRILLTFH